MHLKTAPVQIVAFKRSGRFFHATSVHENMSGWYFRTREGVNYGPYISVAEAQEHCVTYTRQCIANNNDGGRTQHQKPVLIPKARQKSA